MFSNMSVFKAGRGSSADRPLARYSKLNLSGPFSSCGYSRFKRSALEPIITHYNLDSLGNEYVSPSRW